MVLDGVELLVPHSVTCADCLQRTIKKIPEWFHRVVVASTVGPGHRVVLDWDTVPSRDGEAKPEGEQTVAYRRLNDRHRQYHQPIAVMVADALDASRVFVEAVRQHGWDVVTRLKDGQRLTILSDAQRLKTPPSPFRCRGRNATNGNCGISSIWEGVAWIISAPSRGNGR